MAPAEKEAKKEREGRLRQAIAKDNVDEVHNLIVEERELLDRLSKHPFPNTPLHLAAAAGSTQVAMEMAILKPSFAKKLNEEAYSPMHLALQHKNYQTVRALVALNPELIRVRGRGGITPLHYVAEREGDIELELLAEFLRTCKLSIEDLTSRCETAVHVAVKSDNLKAFKVLLGWLKRVSLKQILNWKDQDGNTVLHIAVLEKQPKIIKRLIKNMDINSRNFDYKTALQIFNEHPCGGQAIAKRLRRRGSSTTTSTLSEYYSMKLTNLEKYEVVFGLGDQKARDIILVVSTLIATATYQAALSPPGGYWQDDSSLPSSSANATSTTGHLAGDIIMKGWSLYFFSIVNSMAFFVSIGTIWATAIPLLPRTNMVCVAMVILGIGFSYSLVSQFPKAEEIPANLLGALYVSLLVAGLVVPWVVWSRHFRTEKRIDATGRLAADLLGRKI